MAFRYFSPTNSFLPVATGQVIGFVRDPKKFKINRYVQNVPSPAVTASYYKLDRENPVRVTSDASFAWQDGDKRPSGNHNKLNFKLTAFQTERRAYPFTIGNQTVGSAKRHGKFDIIPAHSNMAASQAVTNRTNRIVTLLQTASNWPTTNTADAAVLNQGAGQWNLASSDENSAAHAAIFKSLMAAYEAIKLQTNSTVQISDLRLLLSPGAARRIAASGEIRAYMKGSVHTVPVIKGDDIWNPNEEFGLPPKLYGLEVVVEDAVLITDKPYEGGEDTTAATRTFVKNDDTAVIVSRQGALDGVLDAPSFSTVQCFWYSDNKEEGGGELDVEVRTDDWNRLTEGSCVEQFAEVLAAGQSGYLVTDILS